MTEPDRQDNELRELAEWIEQCPTYDEYITIQISIDQRASVVSALRAIPQSRGAAEDAVAWAASRWTAEVANRPLKNVHRRSLDTTWRQVIRHFGGDDVALCGPTHDELVSS